MNTTRVLTSTALALLFGALATAATTNTTLTVDATGTIGANGLSASGTASLTGIGNGTFSGSLATADLVTGKASFTITLSNGTITGTLTIPLTLISNIIQGIASSGTVVGTITGGTGDFAGATGSFPALTGSGKSSSATAFSLSFAGAGTITTGGTTGGGPTSPTPKITAVLDAGGYTSGIAQGSIFVVKGTNLSPAEVAFTSYPLPTTFHNVKITFTPTSGGSGTDAYMVYTCCSATQTQLAAVLPSTLAAGNYNVTVTNNGVTSAPFTAAVVQRKPGLITQDGSGTGLALVDNYISATQLDVNRFTTGVVSGATISPAKPGQTLIAVGTGLGAVTGGDNIASPGFDFASNGVTVRVIVGGVSIVPLYAGRAPGFAGEDQINFTLPSNVPTGCTVSFQISVNGVLSNSSFISIAPDASSSACVYPGFTSQQLQSFDQGVSYTLGSFGLNQLSETLPQVGTVKLNSVSGLFAKFTGFQLSGVAQYQPVQSGSCQVLHVTGTQGGGVSSGGTAAVLDAGAITLNGPAGSNISNMTLKQDATNIYSLALASDGLPSIPGVTGGTGTIVAGAYTLSGAGGKDVGKFNASLTVGPPLTINGGLPTTITRSSGMPLTWTGGNPSDLVEIVGYAGTITGTGANATTDATEFICTSTAGQGGFTVPASVLNQLPAVSSNQVTNGTGVTSLEVLSTVNPTSGNGQFTAPLTAGGSIDAGFFLALVGYAGTPSYQ
jgi:uncharacterized protein (TIGR03437 family)